MQMNFDSSLLELLDEKQLDQQQQVKLECGSKVE
jgi:hypothetical protein